jgi:hypothetical protein
MKRLAPAIVACVLAVGLVAPTTAGASIRQLRGPVSGGGTISFNVVRKNGKTRVTKLKALGLPITCNDGTHEAGVLTAPFVFKVRRDRTFGATLVNDVSNPTAFFNVHGRLSRKRTKAHGTLRLHGDDILTNDGARNGCDTGFRDWSAHRV